MPHRAVGNIRIMRALEMVMPFGAGDFFPGVAREEWAPHAAWLAPHAYDPERHEVKFAIQSYVLRTSHHTILIDACVGNDKERPTRDLWHRKTDDTYLRALASHGLAPEDIDFVMCTHLHSDHVGWNTRLENGRWVPTFPNARYVFTRKELEAWRDGGDPKFARDPYEDSVLPVVEAGRVDLVDEDHALDDEVWLEPTPGHTPGHVAVMIASKGEQAVMSGDVLHSPVQCAEPDWAPWPDWDAEAARHTRHAFLDRFCETGTLVCTAHFPPPSAGVIVRAGDAFGFEYEDGSW